MARPRVDPLRGETGFSVVEVIVALLLLAVISAGIGMAFVGSARVQGTARVQVSMNTAAERVVDYLRSHRTWMDTCSASTQPAGVSDQSQVPDSREVPPASTLACTTPASLVAPNSSLLEDASLNGSVCPGIGDPYHHRLVSAWAKPVDSASDGVGAADKDGVIADYFRLVVRVGLQCSADYQRLFQRTAPNPMPQEWTSLSNAWIGPVAQIDTMVDPRGNVARGTLVVEMCQSTNQRDERMPVTGCEAPPGAGLKMMQCPQVPATMTSAERGPLEGCAPAWNFADNTYDDAVSTSAFVHLQRVPGLNFSISNGAVTKSSTTAGVDQGDGTYVFSDLPAGTWTLTTPMPTMPGIPFEIWRSKVIPSQTTSSTQVQVLVQPDVKSQAMVPFARSTTSSGATFEITFERRVVTRNVTSVHVPAGGAQRCSAPTVGACGTQVDNSAPSAVYEGNTALLRNINNFICGMVNFGGLGATANCIDFAPVAGAPGCLRGGYQVPGSVAHLFSSCTRYALYVDADYWISNPSGDAVYDGPAVWADYGVAAAPTYRELTKSGSCATAAPTAPAKATYAVFGCVSGAYSKTAIQNKPTTITLGPLAPGLNTGLWAQNGGGSYASEDDRAGSHSWQRNEEEISLPAAIKSPLWIRPSDRRIITQAGATYASGTTFTVRGKGECRWRFQGGSNANIGSCDPCEPFIEPLDGQVNGCYLLHQVCYRRHIFYTSLPLSRPSSTDVAIQNYINQQLDEQDRWDKGCVSQQQTCYGAPDIGTNVLHVITNCRAATTVGIPSTVPRPIPSHTVSTPKSVVRLPETQVGSS